MKGNRKELPREKAKRLGIGALNEEELLALVLRSGQQGKDVFQLAASVLEKAGGFDRLFPLDLADLNSVKGIKEAKAFELLAVFEIAKRQAFFKIEERTVFGDPEELASWLRLRTGFEEREVFTVLYLNGRGALIEAEDLFKGDSRRSVVGTDIIMRRALYRKASHLIVAHNHPGGDPRPSPEDRKLTAQIKEACRFLNMELTDHIIVGPSSYFSFKSEGLL